MNSVPLRINCNQSLNPAYTLYNFYIWKINFFLSSYYFLCMCGKLFNGPDLISLFLCNYLIFAVINENFHSQTVILLVFNEI